MSKKSTVKIAPFAPTRLRAYREAAGLTLQDVADEVGRTPGGLSRVERGESGYTQATVESLARLYGCRVVDLIDDDPQATAAESLLLQYFRAASPEKRADILKIARVMAGDPADEARPTVASPDVRQVPERSHRRLDARPLR